MKGKDKTLYFGPEGVTFSIYQRDREKGDRNPLGLREAAAGVMPATTTSADRRWNVRLEFEGIDKGVRPEGGEKTETKFSYFKGSKKDWKTGIPTYRKIAYRDLWPGVDLVYSGSMDLLKQDFVVKAGSDPDRIRLAWVGPESVTVTDDGGMEIVTPLGGFRDERPVAYQVIGGEKVKVDVAYDLEKIGDRYRYGFRLGAYDRTKELVIDPLTFIYAGFIGGSGDEYSYDIAVDGSGNVYVTGFTTSTDGSFPATVGPDLAHNGGTYDVFVAKVNSDGSSLTYAGFIGGDGIDMGAGIAVDGSGNAYVSGSTSSTGATFPVTGGPDLTQNGGYDAFVAKVNPAGTALIYAGFIGGNGGDDEGYGIAVDGGGNAYVAGYTDSTQTTFPDGDGFGTVTGPDLTHNGGYDAFVAKVAADGTSLTYAGFIGGSGTDYGYGIAVDGDGNAYVSGSTASTQTTFPDGDLDGDDLFEVPGFDQTHNGGYDGFVAKVNPAGTALVYAGFIGGSVNEFSTDIAIDGSGNAYVVGYTVSTQTTFPDGDPDGDDSFEVPGPDQTQNGGIDAFVAKVASDGTSLTYAGFIGGSGTDIGSGIAVDGGGNAYVSGETTSTEATFPDGDLDGDDSFEVPGPDQTQNGGNDAFVAKIAADGASLTYAGYIGGSGDDFSYYGIAVDGSGNLYVAGTTASTETTFPETAGSLDTSQNGGYDAFVAKIGIVAVCGDSVVEGSEGCDDGNAVNTDACLTTCVAAACGDGNVRAGTEGCDDGNLSNTDACLTTCVAASCGDGYVRAGTEGCDDGNAANTDACLTTCVAASCGDGYTRAGTEACDDGNAVNTDACLTTCVAASCGDGYVRAGTEACDDGNAVNTDACLTTCVLASCGDGHIQSGEECDNGGTNSNTVADACRPNCMNPSCGDDVVDTGEGCDDDNTDNGDGCDSACEKEPGTPDLSVTVTAPSGLITVGSNATFRVSVDNAADYYGANGAAGNSLHLTLSSNQRFISATAETVAASLRMKGASVALSCTGLQSVDCDLPDIAAGGSVGVDVVTLVTTGGSLTMAAAVTTSSGTSEGSPDDETATTGSTTATATDTRSLARDNIFGCALIPSR